MNEQTAVSDIFWSLCHGADQVRIDGLQLVQVQAVIRSFDPANYEAWFVWYEGANDWVPLIDHLPLIFGPSVDAPVFNTPLPTALVPAAATPQPKPAVPEVHTQTATTSNIATETITRSITRDGRQMPRFQMAIEAVVEFKGRMIRTKTVDISLAGMKVADSLPFPADSIVLVTLKYKGMELGMRCKLVESSDRPQHHRLLIETCNRMEVMRSWILGAPPIATRKA